MKSYRDFESNRGDDSKTRTLVDINNWIISSATVDFVVVGEEDSLFE
jgi:hypothetical protein